MNKGKGIGIAVAVIAVAIVVGIASLPDEVLLDSPVVDTSVTEDTNIPVPVIEDLKDIATEETEPEATMPEETEEETVPEETMPEETEEETAPEETMPEETEEETAPEETEEDGNVIEVKIKDGIGSGDK